MEEYEEILSQNRDKLDALAALLLEKEKISASEFEELFTGKKEEVIEE